MNFNAVILAFMFCALVVGHARAANILFVVDDDAGVAGVPDKGSVDAGSDTNVGPGAHPAIGMLQRLQALGHTVTVRDDGPSSAADLVGKDLVVISSSVGSGDITFAKFGNTALPIINMEPAAWDNLLMASLDADGVAGSIISITDPAHPLAAGLSGDQTVATGGNTTLNRGRAGTTFGSGAALVATGPEGGVSLFEYAPGALLTDGTPAAGRRIGFFWNATGTTFNDTAGRLFDNAVTYALVPEPGAIGLIAVGSVLLLRRRTA